MVRLPAQSVATQLVGEGKLLKAQARLGHRDPATTLRLYSHVTPLDDLDIADEIDQRLNDYTNDPTWHPVA
jgi:integrase